jgi:hypothetical protein
VSCVKVSAFFNLSTAIVPGAGLDQMGHFIIHPKSNTQEHRTSARANQRFAVIKSFSCFNVGKSHPPVDKVAFQIVPDRFTFRRVFSSVEVLAMSHGR